MHARWERWDALCSQVRANSLAHSRTNLPSTKNVRASGLVWVVILSIGCTCICTHKGTSGAIVSARFLKGLPVPCRSEVAEITAQADGSAEPNDHREPDAALGVYRDVFEQSLLLEQGNKKPWNFLASLSAELLLVSLALLIPVLYSDHLPVVHWRDVMVGPPPSPPPVVLQPTHAPGSTSPMPAQAQPRVFQWNPKAALQSPETTSMDFTPDAPPTLPGVPGSIGGSNNSLGRFIPNVVALPPPPPPKPVVEKKPEAPHAVGGDVQMAKLIRKVIPVYPPLARSARISGVVRLVGIIGKDGTIQNLQLVSGHPLLTRAAIEAVEQWVYKPTLLNGVPVDVIAPIEVNFTLGQ